MKYPTIDTFDPKLNVQGKLKTEQLFEMIYGCIQVLFLKVKKNIMRQTIQKKI